MYGKRGAGAAPIALWCTRCLTPASYAAAATCSLASRLTLAKVWFPFSRITATRWMTASQPLKASTRFAPSAMSAFTKVTLSRFGGRFVPRAMTTTSWSASVSARTTCLPTKPVPPVTATRTPCLLGCRMFGCEAYGTRRGGRTAAPGSLRPASAARREDRPHHSQGEKRERRKDGHGQQRSPLKGVSIELAVGEDRVERADERRAQAVDEAGEAGERIGPGGLEDDPHGHDPLHHEKDQADEVLQAQEDVPQELAHVADERRRPQRPRRWRVGGCPCCTRTGEPKPAQPEGSCHGIHLLSTDAGRTETNETAVAVLARLAVRSIEESVLSENENCLLIEHPFAMMSALPRRSAPVLD